jgi:hypothetical protein
METPLALEDITGLALTTLGVLVEQYVKEGYADPIMYRALEVSASLTEQFRARLEYDGESNTELLDGVTQLLVDLRVTAMECGEVVNRIIEEHGLPVDKDTWNRTDCDHTDGEETE